MVRPSHDGNKLVHDAAGNTGEIVFSLLAEQRFFDGINFFAGHGFQQGRGGDFQRRTAA